MSIQWSPQQQEAIDAGRRWLDAPKHAVSPVFYLAGYAGSGKSTLAEEFNRHIGGGALAGAYTGKAASVMRKKGLANATTIHRLIYDPVGSDAEAQFKELKKELEGLERGEASDLAPQARQLRIEALRRQMRSIEDDARQPKFVLKDESELSSAPLLILDECSMVSQDMAEDLLSFGCRVLVLGDPAQLPPVRGTGYFTDRQPDVLLTEIHRQAQDNPILRLATLARQGKEITFGEWESPSGSARVVKRVTADEALRADMVLCGTNNKRQAINRRHRDLGGHVHPMPELGERLCCLKNNHDLGLQNGTLWTVTQTDAQWAPGESTIYLHVRPEEGGTDIGIPVEAPLFYNDQEKPAWSSNELFTWGYALTCHKAQGSQWDNIVAFDDWPSHRSYREWLYTLITRAATELTLVRS